MYLPTETSSTSPQQIHVVLNDLLPGQRITVTLKLVK
jgi:hypothetical protein